MSVDKKLTTDKETTEEESNMELDQNNCVTPVRDEMSHNHDDSTSRHSSIANSEDGLRPVDLDNSLDDQAMMTKAYMGMDIPTRPDLDNDSGTEVSSNSGSVCGYSPHNGHSLTGSPRISPSKTRRKSDKVNSMEVIFVVLLLFLITIFC